MHSPVTDEERRIVVAGQLDIDGIEHQEYVPPGFREPRKPCPVEVPPQDGGA
jgi:hypothetical protein